ncbi:uncharacterized protein TRAVEDRAFT_49371 [Trametes versicolor FP-101664 SS1]|uniref:uncharacterized protein n=1 Tax=Trametes versicolor (strain FP-101664) TaxID=717944 RepID=UPI000462245C|nr:uncharacterized protein TRAVEDRAFT_49371 [Trametes versicolor FP-101664 SS1]EIW56547.1 hypothetical protein TRAVEDRAFT_49371 [Trametes versicolor FP-101664 SS1]
MSTLLPDIPSPISSDSSTPYIWHGTLDSSLGAWLLGTYCGLVLYGLLVYQIYQYLSLYPKDPAILKIWVSAILLVETLNTVFTVHSSYYYLVTWGGRSIIFNKPPIWTMNSIALTGPLAITISQGFFARRVYIMAPRFRMVVYVVTVLLLGFCGCFLALAVEAFKAKNFFAQSLPFSGYVAAGVPYWSAAASVLACDPGRPAVADSSDHSTDSLIDLLVLYAVSTGLLNCLVNVLDLAFALCFPTTMIYTSFSIALTKLYGNSFLTALNTRQSFVDRGLVGDTMSAGYRRSNAPRLKLSTLAFAPHRLSLSHTTELTAETDPTLGTASRSSGIELKTLSPATENVQREGVRVEEGDKPRGDREALLSA